MLEKRDESVIGGAIKQCMLARKHQNRTDTGIESDACSFTMFWLCGESGTGNGQIPK